jgi:hypothetical protein
MYSVRYRVPLMKTNMKFMPAYAEKQNENCAEMKREIRRMCKSDILEFRAKYRDGPTSSDMTLIAIPHKAGENCLYEHHMYPSSVRPSIIRLDGTY